MKLSECLIWFHLNYSPVLENKPAASSYGLFAKQTRKNIKFNEQTIFDIYVFSFYFEFIKIYHKYY